MLEIGKILTSQVIENTFVNDDYQTISNAKAGIGLGKEYDDKDDILMQMLSREFHSRINKENSNE